MLISSERHLRSILAEYARITMDNNLTGSPAAWPANLCRPLHEPINRRSVLSAVNRIPASRLEA